MLLPNCLNSQMFIKIFKNWDKPNSAQELKLNQHEIYINYEKNLSWLLQHTTLCLWMGLKEDLVLVKSFNWMPWKFYTL